MVARVHHGRRVNVTRRAMRGAALAPLSKEQKTRMIMLMLGAFANVSGVEGRGEKAFDDWRHEEVFKAVHKSGLRACVNADYKPLRAHFLMLAGRPREAAREAIAAQTEPRSWAERKLRDECDKAADVLPGAWNYAKGFLLNKRGLDIEDCPEKDLWHAVFLVRRRAQQLRKKIARGTSGLAKTTPGQAPKEI